MLTNKFKVNYSIGAIPNGIKTDTFTFFLLFFYSNIIGLNPGLAGLAIFIALCLWNLNLSQSRDVYRKIKTKII